MWKRAFELSTRGLLCCSTFTSCCTARSVVAAVYLCNLCRVPHIIHGQPAQPRSAVKEGLLQWNGVGASYEADRGVDHSPARHKPYLAARNLSHGLVPGQYSAQHLRKHEPPAHMHFSRPTPQGYTQHAHFIDLTQGPMDTHVHDHLRGPPQTHVHSSRFHEAHPRRLPLMGEHNRGTFEAKQGPLVPDAKPVAMPVGPMVVPPVPQIVQRAIVVPPLPQSVVLPPAPRAFVNPPAAPKTSKTSSQSGPQPRKRVVLTIDSKRKLAVT